MKFYTKDGNWDLVGNNTPVFFVKDPRKFADFIHTQKRDPQTNLKSSTNAWDFRSLNPESLHQVMILMSDRGTPHGYRHMHGFGSHTFSMINAANERVWVKFHLVTQQGVRNFTNEEAAAMSGITGPYRDVTINRQISHFMLASLDLGTRVAAGIGVQIDGM